MKENWTYKKLGEVAAFIGDGDWIESRHQSELGIRLIQTGNIGNGVFKAKEDKPHYISEQTFNELDCTEIYSGDCLVSRLPDPIGRACIIPEIGCRMITAVDCTIIRFNEILYPQFFVYYTGSKEYEREIRNHTTGSTRKRISRKNLELVKIPVPSLETQQHIISELDLLQSIIDKQKAQLKELDNLAQAVFYDMFGDPVENDKGWETAELNDVCDVRDGTHDSPSYYEDGYPLITSKNVIDGKISFEDVNYISKEDFDNISKRSRVDDGDIIMPMIGTIGKPVVVKKDREFAIKNVALIKFISDSKVVNVYIQAIMSSKAFDIYMKSKNRGGNQKFIALGDIRKLKVSVPPLSLQQSFASKIESIEKQKAAIGKSIEETQKLFDYTMDKYFG